MEIQDVFQSPKIRWHQRFTIDGVASPGYHDMDTLISNAEVPVDLTGLSVLDVGTTNGAASFECEKRGARQVVAVDICPPDVFGFDQLARYLKSDVKFLQSSIYNLPANLKGQKFDYVIFWGVLYHLRHPLLGLDALAQISSDHLSLETVISSDSNTSATFFRGTELGNDGSNWWAPSEHCLKQMLSSSGFTPEMTKRWDAGISERAIVNSRKGSEIPEYLNEGYDNEIFDVTLSTRTSKRLV
jgi:tRNA (mo5U34)-methyltransferase